MKKKTTVFLLLFLLILSLLGINRCIHGSTDDTKKYKDFLDYTFENQHYIAKKKTYKVPTLPSLNAYTEATYYDIQFIDSENTQRNICLEGSISESTIQTAMCKILQDDLEIEKNIKSIVDKQNISINTNINFKEPINIMNIQNGVKLYNIYEFLENQNNLGNILNISTNVQITFYGEKDTESYEKLLVEKTNIEQTITQNIYKKLTAPVNFNLNITEIAGSFI